MKPKCVKCGQELDEYEGEVINTFDVPPGCFEHVMEIYDESKRGYGMWPRGWYGHCIYSNKKRRWITFEKIQEIDKLLKRDGRV